jgi:hypothetical protein
MEKRRPCPLKNEYNDDKIEKNIFKKGKIKVLYWEKGKYKNQTNERTILLKHFQLIKERC